jgi:hypothetical protein
MSTDRYAAFGDHLTADFKAQSFGGRVESGYRFGTPIVGVTPYAAVQAQSFRTPGYSEVDGSAGGFGLSYNSRTGSDTRSELGSRFDHVAAFDRNAVLTLRARLAWAHDWVSNPSLAAAFQTLPGTSFIVNGATPARNCARLRRRRASPRQWRDATRQVRRRIRARLANLCRHRHYPLRVVEQPVGMPSARYAPHLTASWQVRSLSPI